jgi:Arc/MetJ-type ribon-helix-helix transcriptional regulator
VTSPAEPRRHDGTGLPSDFHRRHVPASQTGIRRGILTCMSTQIAVRLPDEMVAFLDRTVAAGQAASRAALVASAVEREMRRLAAEQDAQILRAQGAADDLDDLVEWTSTHVRVED